MHLDFNTLLSLIAPTLQTAATAAITWAAVKGIKLINSLIDKIHNDRIRAFVASKVAAVEQTAVGRLSGPEKKAEVVAAVKKRFPGVSDELVNILVEAAVRGLTAAVPPPTAVLVPGVPQI